MTEHTILDQREDWHGGWIQSCSCEPQRYMNDSEWREHTGEPPGALMSEVWVCGVEDGVRCPHLEGQWAHFCCFDEGHEDIHECGCGHVWADQGGDE